MSRHVFDVADRLALLAQERRSRILSGFSLLHVVGEGSHALTVNAGELHEVET